MWDTAKVVPKGKWIALNFYIRIKERSQINSPKGMNKHFTKDTIQVENKDMMDVQHH